MIAEAIDRQFVARLAPLGIRPRHLNVLRYLSAHGPISQQALADGIRVDSGNLIDTLDELQTLGLIEREIDPSDRRRRQLQLTPTGARKLRQGIAASEQADNEILGRLTHPQRESLHALALHVYEHLRKPTMSPSQECQR